MILMGLGSAVAGAMLTLSLLFVLGREPGGAAVGVVERAADEVVATPGAEPPLKGELEGERPASGAVYESPAVGRVEIPAGFPTPESTGLAGIGVEPGELPVYEGPTTITDTRTIEGRRIESNIVVDGGELTIRGSYVASGVSHVVLLTRGGGELIMEDSTVRATNGQAHTLRGSRVTIRRSDLRQGTTIAQLGNRSWIEDSFVADAGIPEYAEGHHDGVQILNAVEGVTVKGNTILGAYQGQNSAMHVLSHSNWSGVHDVHIEGNYLSGGNYTLYLVADDEQEELSGAVVRDNVWNAGSWRYGPVSRGNVASDLVWENNRTTNGDPVN